MPRKKKTTATDTTVFTAAQRDIIEHTSGPMLAGAVAGAGKSTTLVERVARLQAAGTPPHRILLSAFNTDAAADLNRKLKKRLGVRGEEMEVARTLHGLAYAVWKRSASSAGFLIDKSGGFYTRAIRQASHTSGIPAEVELVNRFATRVKNDCLVNSYVYGLRSLGRTPADLVEVAEQVVRKKKDCATSPARLLDLFFAAEDARTNGTQLQDGTKAKFVTFDDLLVEAAALLSDDEDAQAHWRGCYDYVIIDEAQDLCEAQWRIVNALAEDHRNILVVGDVAQCVYRFRGARPENLLDFPKQWDGTRQVFMQENFRSGSEIIRAANVILDKIPDSQKLPMRLVSTRDLAGFVGYRESDDPDEEARDIAENIRKHANSGVEWKEQAVLVRRNDQSAALELALLKAKIPARIVRGGGFFSTKEAKATVAHLRLLMNRASPEDFEVAILNPPKYLGRSYSDRVVQFRSGEMDWLDAMQECPATLEGRNRNNAQSFIDAMRDLRLVLAKKATPIQLFTKMAARMNWYTWVAGETGEADNDALLNFDRVKGLLSEFEDASDFLNLVDDLREAQKAAAASRNAVSISTAHGAKGLEYRVVYIAGLVDGVWPMGFGGTDLIDERRLFYVAVTRARDELWLNGYRFKDAMATAEAKRSPYLGELSLGPTDHIGAQILTSGQLRLTEES